MGWVYQGFYLADNEIYHGTVSLDSAACDEEREVTCIIKEQVSHVGIHIEDERSMFAGIDLLRREYGCCRSGRRQCKRYAAGKSRCET